MPTFTDGTTGNSLEATGSSASASGYGEIYKDGTPGYVVFDVGSNYPFSKDDWGITYSGDPMSALYDPILVDVPAGESGDFELRWIDFNDYTWHSASFTVSAGGGGGGGRTPGRFLAALRRRK